MNERGVPGYWVFSVGAGNLRAVFKLPQHAIGWRRQRGGAGWRSHYVKDSDEPLKLRTEVLVDMGIGYERVAMFAQRADAARWAAGTFGPGTYQVRSLSCS